MTREEIEQIENIIHKTIYSFFDICDDNEETAMTEKDDLLLSVNKAICNNIKALESKTDVLGKIRAEIEEQKKERCFDDMFEYISGLDDALYIIDKHRK